MRLSSYARRVTAVRRRTARQSRCRLRSRNLDSDTGIGGENPRIPIAGLPDAEACAFEDLLQQPTVRAIFFAHVRGEFGASPALSGVERRSGQPGFDASRRLGRPKGENQVL